MGNDYSNNNNNTMKEIPKESSISEIKIIMENKEVNSNILNPNIPEEFLYSKEFSLIFNNKIEKKGNITIINGNIDSIKLEININNNIYSIFLREDFLDLSDKEFSAYKGISNKYIFLRNLISEGNFSIKSINNKNILLLLHISANSQEVHLYLKNCNYSLIKNKPIYLQKEKEIKNSFEGEIFLSENGKIFEIQKKDVGIKINIFHIKENENDIILENSIIIKENINLKLNDSKIYMTKENKLFIIISHILSFIFQINIEDSSYTKIPKLFINESINNILELKDRRIAIWGEKKIEIYSFCDKELKYNKDFFTLFDTFQEYCSVVYQMKNGFLFLGVNSSVYDISNTYKIWDYINNKFIYCNKIKKKFTGGRSILEIKNHIYTTIVSGVAVINNKNFQVESYINLDISSPCGIDCSFIKLTENDFLIVLGDFIQKFLISMNCENCAYSSNEDNIECHKNNLVLCRNNSVLVIDKKRVLIFKWKNWFN